MKPWWKPQSRYVEDLIRAMRNGFAMLGLLTTVLIILGAFGVK